MFITGISDEAGPAIETQIKAAKELGWNCIEIRAVEVGDEKANIHDISDAAFDTVVGKLEEAGIGVSCFGSTIANWGKKITEPFDSSLEEARRALPRMKRLKVPFVRIMSFAVDAAATDHLVAERVKRLRELVDFFGAEGITAVHENCMNYGGMGYAYTQELLREVPGLKLVFDTGNPVFTPDYAKGEPGAEPNGLPRQSALEFYQNIKGDALAYVHIKDGVWDETKKEITFSYPGEGEGAVREIVADLLASGYDGGFSIEPHMGAVFHDPSVKTDAEVQYNGFVEYGKRMAALIEEAKTAA